MSAFPPPAPPYLGPAAHTTSGSNLPVNRIVIHSTVSPCVAGGARGIARYFRSASAGGSAHYVVDPIEEVQVVGDSKIAWHAPPNSHSIGIELCDMPSKLSKRRWKDKEHAAMLRRAARLTAQLCLAYDVPAVKLDAGDLRAGRKGICGHTNVSAAWHQSSHWDPGAFPWKTFITMVRAEIADLEHGLALPVPTAPRQVERLVLKNIHTAFEGTLASRVKAPKAIRAMQQGLIRLGYAKRYALPGVATKNFRDDYYRWELEHGGNGKGLPTANQVNRLAGKGYKAS